MVIESDFHYDTQYNNVFRPHPSYSDIYRDSVQVSLHVVVDRERINT